MLCKKELSATDARCWTPLVATVVLKGFERHGYRKVILKSDQKITLQALAQAVKHAWTGKRGGTRCTIAPRICEDNGRAVDPRSASLAWLMEHAGTLLSLCHRGAPCDGFASCERLKGTSWKTEFLPFGEVLVFQRKTEYKFERR